MITAEFVKTYVLQLDGDGHVLGEVPRRRTYTLEEIHDAGVEVDRRAKAYMEATGTQNYSVAVHRVLEVNPDLKAAYSQ